MLDFTSALYLGFRHPTASLGSWESLSLGQPAALREPDGAGELASELARLQGCEAGTLLPSTLHLFWDLFAMWARERVAVFFDDAAYRIARWGMTPLVPAGVPVVPIRHRAPSELRPSIEAAAARGRRPVILVDGYCTGCNTATPLAPYSELARRHEGYLVIDDTQALGVLGEAPSEEQPLGCRGGGSLRFQRMFGPHIVVGSSLAKGFGAPLAVLSGSRALVARFREQSQTRVHCSPPTSAVIHAARRALELNRRVGERLRERLVALVRALRASLSRAGLFAAGRLPFPAQTFRAENAARLTVLHEQLRKRGVESLLTAGCGALGRGLTFVVTPRHGSDDVEHPARLIAQAGARAVTHPMRAT